MDEPEIEFDESVDPILMVRGRINDARLDRLNRDAYMARVHVVALPEGAQIIRTFGLDSGPEVVAAFAAGYVAGQQRIEPNKPAKAPTQTVLRDAGLLNR